MLMQKRAFRRSLHKSIINLFWNIKVNIQRVYFEANKQIRTIITNSLNIT